MFSKKSDPSTQHIFRFIQRTITIGKDLTNNLRLCCCDESVSQIHAEIYSDMDNFFVVDRGSSSGTHIENVKLVRNRSYLLLDGTQIGIGEYLLTFLLNLPDEDYKNLERMSVINTIKYLDDSLISLHNTKVNNPDLYDQNISENLARIFDVTENKNLRSLLVYEDEGEHDFETKYRDNNLHKLDFIVDMFLKLFVEFNSMSIKISKEFVDSHTVHRRDSQQLVFPDSLKNYILNTDLSSEEKKERINFLWHEIEELILKHIALFAGYKSSIKYGTRDLLKELDPVSIIDDEQRKSRHYKSTRIIDKYVPFVKEHRNIKTIKEKFEALSKNIDKEIELKYYQPAFKSGYLQKVNSVHQSDYDLNH